MATKEHCFLCFDALYERLFSKRLSGKTQILVGETSFPLFVTWNIKTDGNWILRGCIGNFNPMPLDEGLREYAIVSALRDNRFNPISTDEFNQLQCGVSLLLCFENCSAWDDWEIGKHGIRISFQILHRSYSATYLPFVAFDQNWDHQQTMKSLVNKAGHRGSIDYSTIKVVRYQVCTSFILGFKTRMYLS